MTPPTEEELREGFFSCYHPDMKQVGVVPAVYHCDRCDKYWQLKEPGQDKEKLMENIARLGNGTDEEIMETSSNFIGHPSNSDSYEAGVRDGRQEAKAEIENLKEELKSARSYCSKLLEIDATTLADLQSAGRDRLHRECAVIADENFKLKAEIADYRDTLEIISRNYYPEPDNIALDVLLRHASRKEEK